MALSWVLVMRLRLRSDKVFPTDRAASSTASLSSFSSSPIDLSPLSCAGFGFVLGAFPERASLTSLSSEYLFASRSLESASASFERGRVMEAPSVAVAVWKSVSGGFVSVVGSSVLFGPSVRVVEGF